MDCSRQIPDGNAVTNDCRFPSRHAIDYAALLSAARAESEMNLTLILKEQLVSQWCDRYVRTATHVANLVRFPFRTFEYILTLTPNWNQWERYPTTRQFRTELWP